MCVCLWLIFGYVSRNNNNNNDTGTPEAMYVCQTTSRYFKKACFFSAVLYILGQSIESEWDGKEH